MIALVLGSAATLFDDLRAWDELHPIGADAVIAVNDAGVVCRRRIDHWTHLHTEQMPERLAQRAKLGGNTDYVTWSRRRGANGERPDRIAPQHFGAGSSGLYAVGLALRELGCTNVVLCGVPLDDTPRFGDGVPWSERDPASGINKIDLFRKAWLAAFPQLDRRVKSMSGWTYDLLGAPSHEWLARTEV